MRRVVVVDLFEATRRLLVRVLEQDGFDAVGVASTADAIAACSSGAGVTELILAACHDPLPAAVHAMLMPIRSHPTTSGMPLLVATDDREVIAEAIKFGACDCLVRAWANLDELVECVRRNLPK